MSKRKRDAECIICREENKEIHTFCDQDHACCRECVIQYVKSKVALNDRIPCFGTQCKSCIDIQVLKDLLSSEGNLLEWIEYLKQKRAKEENPLWRPCPREKCRGGAIANAGKDKEVTCDSCSLCYCKECAREHHPESECQKERVTFDLADFGKRCPACQTWIQRSGGCPHMTCERCKWEFCYLCSSPWYSGHMVEVHAPPEAIIPTLELVDVQNVVTLTYRPNRRDRTVPIRIETQLAQEQVQKTIPRPPLRMSIDTTQLIRQRIDLSLIDSNDRIIPDGLVKTKKELRILANAIEFGNIKIASLGLIHAKKSPGSDGQYRIRADVGEISAFSNAFTIVRTKSGSKRRK